MIKRLVKTVIASPAGWRAVARLRPRGVVVLTYHRVSPPCEFQAMDIVSFRDQMRWIRRRCRPIAPDELRDLASVGGQRQPPVLITFDDGYRDYHDHVYPVLDELKIPAVVFLATAYMDDPGRLFWWDKVHLATLRSPQPCARLPWTDRREMDLGDAAARQAFIQAAADHLRRIREPARGELLAALLHELGDPDLSVPRQMLSWDEVRSASGLTTWGGHTHSHPIMSLLDAQELEDEVRLCRERIESETGVRPRYFAYPNGKAEDFSPEVSAALARHGFEVAFATEPGVAGPGTDWLAVKRMAGSGSASRNLGELAWVVSGLGARRAGVAAG